MDLICTYHASLQQDGIMPDIWTLIWTVDRSVFWNLHKTIILLIAFNNWKMYCFHSAIVMHRVFGGRPQSCKLSQTWQIYLSNFGRFTTFILSNTVETTLLQKLLQRSKQNLQIQTKVRFIKQISAANWEQKDWLIELCKPYEKPPLEKFSLKFNFVSSGRSSLN